MTEAAGFSAGSLRPAGLSGISSDKRDILSVPDVRKDQIRLSFSV